MVNNLLQLTTKQCRLNKLREKKSKEITSKKLVENFSLRHNFVVPMVKVVALVKVHMALKVTPSYLGRNLSCAENWDSACM